MTSGENAEMSSRCIDCGKDTTPCTGKRGCRHKGKWEHYMVRNKVWAAAGMPPSRIMNYGESEGHFLCVRCLEERLVRRLRPKDFTTAPINDPSPWDTPRLAKRKRHTTTRWGGLDMKLKLSAKGKEQEKFLLELLAMPEDELKKKMIAGDERLRNLLGSDFKIVWPATPLPSQDD